MRLLRRDHEIDFDAGLWVVPGSRMKGGAPHALPLVPQIQALLKSLPLFAGGDYLFSTTGGKKPVSGFSKAKARLDKLMRLDLETKRAIISAVSNSRYTSDMPYPFLRCLEVEDIVRELLLAHARSGLHKVYDLHAYETEKTEALKLWHEKLKQIVGRKLVLQLR